MATYDRTKVDDAAFTPGTDDVYPIGAMADETSPDSVDEGDVGIPRMTLDRKLLTRVVGATDTSRLEVSTAGAAHENLAQVAGSTVTAGAGAVAAGTQRTTLASDDPAVASLGIIDDWDESDRAKVNPIVGQAGVQGNTGTVNALTQRVTIATDDVVSIDDNGGSITVDGSLTVSGTVTADTELPPAAALTDNFANPTAPAVGSFGMVWDGATWDRAAGTSADGALVNLGANNDVTGTGSAGTAAAGVLTVQGIASMTPVQVGDNSGSLTVDNSALSVTGGGTEATALRVTVATDSTGVLSVDDNGGSLTVDGSVTANAGTNLNTSALALEAGGNLAAAAASLSVVDDWDESDRAKVNPIAGQAGVQGGSGTTNALTQRVVLATDVALPTGTNSIGKISDITTSVTPGTAAGNLGKAEDAAHSSGDTGTMMLGVRNTTMSDITDADGDYSPIATSRSGAIAVSGYSVNDNDLLPIAVESTGAVDVFLSGGTATISGTVTLAYTVAGTDFTAAVSASSAFAPGVKYHSLQVTKTGAVTSWDVRLEGSLDGTTFTQLVQHTNVSGDGVTVAGAAPPFVVNYVRLRCAAIVLGGGTKITAVLLSSA
jgi:filamentous hemagglutinin